MLDRLRRTPPLFLASVTSAKEARIAAATGADILDCKSPADGALGALPLATVREIVAALPASAIVSATVGDLPASAAILVPAAKAMAETGVSIVKVGFFGDGEVTTAIRALKSANLGTARLYAVLMADRNPDFDVIAELSAARFLGVMLDTADKSAGPLSEVMATEKLQAFVERARRAGLIAGLAGSLRRQHIPPLAALRPDILGFRGALCSGGRTGALQESLVAGVRDDIAAAREKFSRTERSVA